MFTLNYLLHLSDGMRRRPVVHPKHDTMYKHEAMDIGIFCMHGTVSGLILATANDEIPDICLSFSPKITRKKSVE